MMTLPELHHYDIEYMPACGFDGYRQRINEIVQRVNAYPALVEVLQALAQGNRDRLATIAFDVDPVTREELGTIQHLSDGELATCAAQATLKAIGER